MRALRGVLLFSALLVLSSGARAGDPPVNGSVVRVHVITDGRSVDGTCALIRREDGERQTVLHFLTSAKLFRDRDAEPSRVHTVQLIFDDGQALEVKREEVILPMGTLVDVALLRATVESTALLSRPVLYDAPLLGEVFMIAGHDRNGERATVIEHVRFLSTLLATGDRDASSLAACVGAPAIGADSIFGVVTECAAGRAPTIALLSTARTFIERHVPPSPSIVTRQFEVVRRQFEAPAQSVACDTTRAGEVDVPTKLGPNEFAIGAEASFTNLRQIQIADVSVFTVDDRAVRLRFTIGGMPRPPTAPTTCPLGQALISVRLDVAIARAR